MQAPVYFSLCTNQTSFRSRGIRDQTPIPKGCEVSGKKSVKKVTGVSGNQLLREKSPALCRKNEGWKVNCQGILSQQKQNADKKYI
jgi:hypothetical protein